MLPHCRSPGIVRVPAYPSHLFALTPLLPETVYVFWPLTKLRIRQLFFRLRMLITWRSNLEREAEAAKFFMAMLPIGKNPFEYETRYQSWVGQFAFFPRLRHYPSSCSYQALTMETYICT